MDRVLDRRLENFKRRYRIPDDRRFPGAVDCSGKCAVIAFPPLCKRHRRIPRLNESLRKYRLQMVHNERQHRQSDRHAEEIRQGERQGGEAGGVRGVREELQGHDGEGQVAQSVHRAAPLQTAATGAHYRHPHYLLVNSVREKRARSIYSRRLIERPHRLLMIWVFDGHVWNMKLLDPDVFTSFSLASMTELPAALLLALFLDRWGRRWMGFASMFICGVFSLVALLTPPGELRRQFAQQRRLRTP